MRLAHIHERLRNIGSGVVDQDIQRRQCCNSLLNPSGMGHVANERMCTPTARLDFSYGGIQIALRARHQPHVGSGMGHRNRRTAPDATSCAGD